MELRVATSRPFSSLILPAIVTLLVLAAPVSPAPFGFWFALAAALVGPGSGVPSLLFPNGSLTVPEAWFVAVLCAVGIDAALLAGLNALAVPLSPLTVGAAILAPTYALNMLTYARNQHRERMGQSVELAGPDDYVWLFFFGGVVFVVCAATIARVLP